MSIYFPRKLGNQIIAKWRNAQDCWLVSSYWSSTNNTWFLMWCRYRRQIISLAIYEIEGDIQIFFFFGWMQGKYNRCRKRPAFYCWCMENILALPQSKDVGDIQICKKATLALRKKLLSFVRKCRDHSNFQGGNFNIKKQTFFWQLHWSVKDKIIIGINSPSKQNQNPSDKELQWYTNAESIFKDNISILGLKFFIGFFSNLSDVFRPFVNRIFQKQILMPTSNKLMISNLLLQRETNMYCSKQYRFL